MNFSTELFIGNFIAGIHSALIVFFFVGWLIPFVSFLKRCLANIFIGGTFLVFWFIGWCPLTVWENAFKLKTGIDSQATFTERQLSLLGITIDTLYLQSISLYLILGILSLALLYPAVVLLNNLATNNLQQ